ncbi:hypothetical protein ATK17_3872 [Branchiibius hedensis]|uniref:Uncharacterized protein n=1 Tax=Branchiibius hedensis TaxID=672460 RepID=A0A2Y9BNX5_9MICO|nr:hypothetical protein ATK17_3872 [Branchiibius hedensis]SSA59061.1 hypothetical protein SAMN04489750_3872 [Branchiibius hedensis]
MLRREDGWRGRRAARWRRACVWRLRRRCLWLGADRAEKGEARQRAVVAEQAVTSSSRVGSADSTLTRTSAGTCGASASRSSSVVAAAVTYFVVVASQDALGGLVVRSARGLVCFSRSAPASLVKARQPSVASSSTGSRCRPGCRCARAALRSLSLRRQSNRRRPGPVLRAHGQSPAGAEVEHGPAGRVLVTETTIAVPVFPGCCSTSPISWSTA